MNTILMQGFVDTIVKEAGDDKRYTTSMAGVGAIGGGVIANKGVNDIQRAVNKVPGKLFGVPYARGWKATRGLRGGVIGVGALGLGAVGAGIGHFLKKKKPIDRMPKEAGIGSMFIRGAARVAKTKAPKSVFTPKARMKVLKGRSAWAGQYGAQTDDLARKATKNKPKINETVQKRRTFLKDETARTTRMSNRMNAGAIPKAPGIPKAPKLPEAPKPPMVKSKKDLAIGAGAGIAGTVGLASLSGGEQQQPRYQQQY